MLSVNYRQGMSLQETFELSGGACPNAPRVLCCPNKHNRLSILGPQFTDMAPGLTSWYLLMLFFLFLSRLLIYSGVVSFFFLTHFSFLFIYLFSFAN
jgi:hypothetical protein